MGDVIYGYVQMANSPPVSKFTDANAGQSIVMDNIAAAGDVVSVIILDNPRVLEISSASIEVGQAFAEYVSTSSPTVDRILFESTEGRLAFIANVLSQWALIPPAQGIPVEPEMAWRDDKFTAATEEDRTAINEIEAAVDATIGEILEKPNIRFVSSLTVRPTEAVILITFLGLTNTIKVRVSNSLNTLSFFHKFISPLAAGLALAGIVVR